MILKNEFRIKYLIPVGNNISEKARKSLIDSFKNDIFLEKFQRQIKIEKILKLI